jgi:hypothetical protein
MVQNSESAMEFFKPPTNRAIELFNSLRHSRESGNPAFSSWPKKPREAGFPLSRE